jgi:hypothetical protein
MALKIGEPILHGIVLLVATLFTSVDGAKFRKDFLKRLSNSLKLLFVHADFSVARGGALMGRIARPCIQDNAASLDRSELAAFCTPSPFRAHHDCKSFWNKPGSNMLSDAGDEAWPILRKAAGEAGARGGS